VTVRLIVPLFFVVALSTAHAHVVSMSSGDLRINGATATYELRIPLYEVADLKDAGRKTLLESIQFGGGRMLESNCREEQQNLVCTARYLFEKDVDELRVQCRFPSITVPNHVHVFRATKADGKTDQAFFDLTLTEANLTFRPPTAAELFLRASIEGVRRGLLGFTTVLFLFALAVVANDRKQFLTLAAILVAVEVLLVSVPTIRLSPKFLEAAAALSTAYLAVEKLLVPQAGQRWLVVAILGVFHGLLFRFFNPESQIGFATGLLAANLLWLGPAALARFLPVKPVAILLALLGTLWFVYRLMF
jgi:hypothetical protein